VAPQVAGWWLVDLVVPPSYAGALVIEEGFDKLSYRQWPAP
jgi:hypothetical protein